ncbi:MAG: metallophosphoesterase family protein [Anaerolineaceae bacterium]|nr:metallophosphoesterase family protein [Anaerolineaceae bacterium]
MTDKNQKSELKSIVAETDPFVVGVVADTHIPDRVDSLHPDLASVLIQNKVQLILHAGDLSTLAVIRELEQIAPVLAVTGNRDFLLHKMLPFEQRMSIYGSEIVLVHGHISPRIYWMDKVQYIALGYSFERYQQRLANLYPSARVILFGHTHHPENRWVGEQLFFNPGAVSHGDYLDRTPYYGLLKFYKGGRIDAAINPLMGAQIHAKQWVQQR